jgi:hypothetical protein
LNFIIKNSQNNFKKLERKQSVRLSFINEVNKVIFQSKEREKEGGKEKKSSEMKTKKILYFLIIYTIIVRKYIEENQLQLGQQEVQAQQKVENRLPWDNIDSSCDASWIDIEQTLFNLVNNLINKPYNNKSKFLNIFYHSSWLIYYLTSQTKDFDNYINLEKYILKIKSVLDQGLIQDPVEISTFRFSMIKILGEAFEKTNNVVKQISRLTHKFIIELIFSSMSERKKFIQDNSENLKILLKNSSVSRSGTYHSKNKSDFSEEISLINLMNDKNFVDLRDIIETYYKYVVRFTTDVTAGKKIWKEVEEYMKNFLSLEEGNILLEVSVIFIFNKCKTPSGKIILSSIFEFLCDKFNSSNFIQIPKTSTIENRVESKYSLSGEKNKSPTRSVSNISYSRQNSLLQNNLNLFYEIICNHYEIILTDQILNERYMLYFARIFIEDTLNEVITNLQREQIVINQGLQNLQNSQNAQNLQNAQNAIIHPILPTPEENDEKYLLRLQEILSQTAEPPKLIMSLLSNISKFFFNQNNLNLSSPEQININNLLLERIYKKLIIFLHKFSSQSSSRETFSHNYMFYKEKSTLERDELFNIIQNFSTNNKVLRQHYIMFFIKFFIFIEFNFKLELEFFHRKKIYVIICEMFYELINNYSTYENPHITIDEMTKLIELLIIVMKTYSKVNLEDGYLIYKMVAMIVKKISSRISEGGNNINNNHNWTNLNVNNFNNSFLINEEEKMSSYTFNKVQAVMTYGLVNIVVSLITGFYQLNAANQSLGKIHSELVSSISEENDKLEKIEDTVKLLDDTFKIIDLHNLTATLNEFHNLLITLNKQESEGINLVLKNETAGKFTSLIMQKYFGYSSPISLFIETEMTNRNLNVSTV